MGQGEKFASVLPKSFCTILIFLLVKTTQTTLLDTVNVDLSVVGQLFSVNQHYPFYPPAYSCPLQMPANNNDRSVCKVILRYRKSQVTSNLRRLLDTRDLPHYAFITNIKQNTILFVAKFAIIIITMIASILFEALVMILVLVAYLVEATMPCCVAFLQIFAGKFLIHFLKIWV